MIHFLTTGVVAEGGFNGCIGIFDGNDFWRGDAGFIDEGGDAVMGGGLEGFGEEDAAAAAGAVVAGAELFERAEHHGSILYC